MLHKDILEEFLKVAYFAQNSGFSKISAFLGSLLGDAQFQEHFTNAIFKLFPFFLDTSFIAVINGRDHEPFVEFSEFLMRVFKNDGMKSKYVEKHFNWLELFSIHLEHLVGLINSDIVVNISKNPYREFCNAFVYIIQQATEAESQTAFEMIIDKLMPLEGTGLNIFALKAAPAVILVQEIISRYISSNRYQLNFKGSILPQFDFKPDQPVSGLTTIPFTLNLHAILGGLKVPRLSDDPNLVIVFPTRFFAAYYMFRSGLIPVRRKSLIEGFKTWLGADIARIHLVNLFRVLQAGFLQSDDHEFVINRIARIFGLFSDFYQDANFAKANMSFFFLIACLLTDTSEQTPEEVLAFSIQLLTSKKSLPFQKILDKARKKLIGGTDQEIRKVIPLVTKGSQTEQGERQFRAKEGFNPLHCCLDVQMATAYLARSFRTELFPFPRLLDKVNGSLKSPTLLVLSYVFLVKGRQAVGISHEGVDQIIFNLLAALSEECPQCTTPQAVCFVHSIQQLLHIAGTVDFHRFVSIPFVATFLNGPKASLKDLIGQSGDVGKDFLSKIGGSGVSKVAGPGEKSRLARERIRQQFAARQERVAKRYQDEMQEAANHEQEEEVCSICGQGGATLCYPVYLYNHWYLKRYPMQMVLCKHMVHATCAGKEAKDGQWICPVDRMPRNALLPGFLHGYEPVLTAETKAAIGHFLDNGIHTLSPESNFPLNITGHLLLNAYRVTDLRLRKDPRCLDTASLPTLLRCVFLVLWSAHRDSRRIFADAVTKPKAQLLVRCIESDNPEIEFKGFVKELCAGLDGVMLYKFLRFACLFSSLSLIRTTSVYDWALELEFESLCDDYELRAPDSHFDLKTFQLINLPQRMIDLALPPFDVPKFDDQTATTVMCLRSGKVLDFQTDIELFIVTISEAQVQTPTFFLFLRGLNAGAVIFFHASLRIVVQKPSVYIDEFGADDVAYGRGEMLQLNRERLEDYEDVLMSGKWLEYTLKMS
jgi:hypothetical protein